MRNYIGFARGFIVLVFGVLVLGGSNQSPAVVTIAAVPTPPPPDCGTCPPRPTQTPWIVTATPAPSATPVMIQMALGEDPAVVVQIGQSPLMEVVRGEAIWGIGQGVHYLQLEKKVIDWEHAWWKGKVEPIALSHAKAIVSFDNRVGTVFTLEIECWASVNNDRWCITNLPGVGEGPKTAFILRFTAYQVRHQLAIWFIPGANPELNFGLQYLPDWWTMS